METRQSIRRFIRQHGGEPSVYIPNEVTSLSVPALGVLMDLVRKCLHERNGNMTAVFRDLKAEQPHNYRSQKVFKRALRELVGRAFIVRVKVEPFKPTRYALAWVGLGMPRSIRHSVYPIDGWRPRPAPRVRRRTR